LKNKQTLNGVIAGLLLSISCIIFAVLFLYDGPLENGIAFLYQKKKLGGLISVSSLINLPVFFLAIRKNKINFAKGLVIISLIIVCFLVVLKFI
tara:strand:- start:167 stop:448 length:282 start_codon:yes stop_codon:yes gene_type:complete